MLLLLVAGVFVSIACATVVGTGSVSPAARSLSFVTATIGTTLGLTAGSVVSSLGASAVAASSAGLILGSLTVIAGNAAIRRRIRSGKAHRHL
ncbi:hypothetical protein [Cohnella boryungensis]|uniref:Uncharacterized protein n=1 Tax=Cohnella boryungensis TaxID=768479 RepID=A0ABV8SBV9_9BACL